MPVIPIRKVELLDDVAKVPLTKGLFAFVDLSDYDFVKQFNWYAMQSKSGHYAVRDIKKDNKKSTILLHRALLGCESLLMVDHINGDGLDNRRCNLRFVTNQQNSFNSRIRPSNTTGFKGVTASKRCGRWLARITHNGVIKNLGRYDTKELAHEAYQKAAASLFGEFANFG